MIDKTYQGVVVPMVTPLTERYSIDEGSTEKVVNHIIDGGASPFILGTTGESVSISRREKEKLVSTTVKTSADRKKVYAGISNNSIAESIDEAKLYSDLGVNVVVSTMASYYPVEPDQILRYYEELADAVPLPLIIYNIPSTTHISIPLDIVDQLSKHHNIAGFKDSENNIDRVKTAVPMWTDREDFSYLMGSASLSWIALTLGADGIVPSSGNLVPHLYNTLFKAARVKDEAQGHLAQNKTNKISAVYQKDRILSKALPVLKAIMSSYGLCEAHMMPPMYKMPLEEEKRITDKIKSSFEDLEQLNELHK